MIKQNAHFQEGLLFGINFLIVEVYFIILLKIITFPFEKFL